MEEQGTLRELPAPEAHRHRGWNRLSWGLLALWVALLGLDRVDFLGGSAGFILTPFLLFTPLLVLFEGVRLALLRERLRLGRAGAVYLVLFLLFLSVVLISTFLALDPLTSAKRSLRLVAQGVGTFLVAATVAGRPGSYRGLVWGAKLGLVVSLVFSAFEIWAFLGGRIEPYLLGPVQVDLVLPTIFGVIPRTSGPVLDSNRAGLLMVFYLFILLRWGRPGLERWGWVLLASALLVLTFSRSSILAAGTTGAFALLATRTPTLRRRTVLAGMMAAAALTGWLLVDGGVRKALVRESAPFVHRLSPQEGSAQDHFHLLGRGLEEATHSVKRAGIGLGYGNAYLVLQDFFPGNKYGNFHSFYLTTLAEAGVFALVLGLILLVTPFVVQGPFRPLIAGFLAYNVFYETPAEPLFWFSLAMAWFTLEWASGREGVSTEGERPERVA